VKGIDQDYLLELGRHVLMFLVKVRNTSFFSVSCRAVRKQDFDGQLERRGRRSDIERGEGRQNIGVCGCDKDWDRARDRWLHFAEYIVALRQINVSNI
jgi:hypothetical protein